MKKFHLLSLYFVLIFFSATQLIAQKSIASPRDTVKGKLGTASIVINYGSPSVKGRKIWGKLVPYGEVWRTGANEATVFTTDQPLKIEGKELPAGQYSFFTIPSEKDWIIIFNKNAKQWGSFEYAEKDDVLRVAVTPTSTEEINEKMNFKLTDKGLLLIWEKLVVPVNITQ